jgi:hypothetical protein
MLKIEFMNDTQLPKSVVIQESPKIPMSAYQFNIKDDKHTTKVAAITGSYNLNFNPLNSVIKKYESHKDIDAICRVWVIHSTVIILLLVLRLDLI